MRINKASLNKGRRRNKTRREIPHSKLESIGIHTGLLDRHGNEIVTGNRVSFVNRGIKGIVLYDCWSKRFGIFYGYSSYSGDKPYDPESYWRVIHIPFDNGMRMEFEITER